MYLNIKDIEFINKSMESICSEHPNQPLTGCNKCWSIEKNRRAHISCKFKTCTSGSCKFRHDPYCHEPNVNCINGPNCPIPWCGYIHRTFGVCGHTRPTLNCVNCEEDGVAKQIIAKGQTCTGNCKIDEDGICYFSHADDSSSDSDIEPNPYQCTDDSSSQINANTTF